MLPTYHVTAERNWMNDPNGPIQWQGRYHLFYQANPDAPHAGLIRWGHVSSTDLVNWQRHPWALEPFDGPDQDGCWSGCARVIDGEPSLYYTGIVHVGDRRIESICRATGSADLMQWTKDPANPLVAGPPADLPGVDHRDPFLWHDDGGWHLIVAAGRDGHGQTLVYHSPDARSWTYGGVFFESPRYVDGVDVGEVWECPALVRFDEADVLILSVIGPSGPRTLYFVGRVIDGRFEGRYGDRLDFGPLFYAPTTMVDESGRHLLWGWIMDERSDLPKIGALTLPRVLALVDGRLRMTPAPELTALREAESSEVAPGEVAPGEVVPGEVVPGAVAPGAVAPGAVAREDVVRQLEIVARPHAGVSTWSIGSLQIVVDLDNNWLSVGGTRAPIHDPADSELRIFLDGSVVEVFLGDQVAVTTRHYDLGGPIEGPPERTMWRLRQAID